MPVTKEIMEGPFYDLSRRNPSGSMKIAVAWSDLVALEEELFPDPISTGYLYSASIPGYPGLVCTAAKVRPLADKKPPNTPDGDPAGWATWHEKAEVDITYGVPESDQKQQSGASGDHSGPGGDHGSTGGQEVTFISHKVHAGGEFITYPSEALRWSEKSTKSGKSPYKERLRTKLKKAMIIGDTRMQLVACAFPRDARLVAQLFDSSSLDPKEIVKVKEAVTNKDKTVTVKIERAAKGTEENNFGVGDTVIISADESAMTYTSKADNISASIVVPTWEHTIEWNYVTRPPWAAIRSCMGKVNHRKFAGIPSECGLFLGAEASREIKNRGFPYWKLSLKISEKNQNALDPRRPQGWNFFMRPTGSGAGQFGRLARRIILDDDGNPPAAKVTVPMSAGQTTMTVSSTAFPFPQYGQFVVRVDNEMIAVTTVLSATSWGVIRGVRQTAAAGHAAWAGAKTGFAGRAVLQPGGCYEVANYKNLFRVI